MRKSAMEINRDTRDLFLRMVGDFALDRKSVYPDCSGELEDLLYLAHIHSLEPVVYYMLREQRKQLLEQKPELFRHMQRAYHSAVYVSVTQEASRAEIEETFKRAGVKLVFFKGVQLRELYPVPELRTMGDMDCLICREDRAKAHALMCQLGYQCEIDDEPVWMYRRDAVVIEMHTLLAAKDIGNGVDYESFFSDAMEHVVKKDGLMYLEREYHLCYLIYHIAKHLCSTGAGVRMIADIAATLRFYGDTMDWEGLKCLLEASHLHETALAIYGLCHKWFGVEPPERYSGSELVLKDLEAYIIGGGVFGFETHDLGDVYRRNAFRGKAANSGDRYRLKMMKEYFFPPSVYLVKYFPLSEKRRWLLPVAWMCRCWAGLFRRKDHSVATIRSMTRGDAELSYREVLMLKEIGL